MTILLIFTCNMSGQSTLYAIGLYRAFPSCFQKLLSIFRSLYKSKGWMMLKDIKRSDLPKNPMPVPEHVMKFPIVWEKPPPSQEKLVVRKNEI